MAVKATTPCVSVGDFSAGDYVGRYQGPDFKQIQQSPGLSPFPAGAIAIGHCIAFTRWGGGTCIVHRT